MLSAGRLCLFLSLVSLLGAEPASLAQRRPIFLDSAVSGDPEQSDQAVARSRFVRVNVPRLLESAPAAAIDLNLFPDRSLRARIERVDALRDHTVYFGRLAGADDGEVVLVVQNGVVAGSIRGGGKLFHIRFAGSGVHEVQEIDTRLLPDEAAPLVATVEADAIPSSSTTAADDGSIIDVFVAYTAAARAGAGGTAGIQALINLGIAETNQAYLNSGVIQRVRLAGTVEVAYAESGDIAIDLDRLRAIADGHMDQVHALRNGSAADLVHLIVGNGGGSCGIGYVMESVASSFEALAFAVTARSCVSPNLTFAHEMGHNMGLQHDRHVDRSNSPFPYSHGYVNQAAFAPGAPANKRWRTIMAYNDECSASGFGCTRLMYFSNPANTYTGDPMGVAGTAVSSSPDGPANARLSLDNTRTTVANFRRAASPPGMPTTLSPSGDVFDATPTFRWLSVPNATEYRLWVRRGAVDVPTHIQWYSSAAAGCPGSGTCSVTPAPALALGVHTFWIQASNSEGAGPFSAGRLFNVLPNGFDSQFEGSTAPWQAPSGAWSIVSGQYLFTAGLNGSIASVSYPLSFANLDFRVRLFRTGSNAGNPTRLIVRGNPTLAALNQWAQGYVFQITRSGLYSVYRDNVTALQGWTASPAIHQGNAWNELRVVAMGSSLSFSINGVLVWSGTDASLASGRVGIGMYRGPGTTGNGLFIDSATLTVPES